MSPSIWSKLHNTCPCLKLTIVQFTHFLFFSIKPSYICSCHFELPSTILSDTYAIFAVIYYITSSHIMFLSFFLYLLPCMISHHSTLYTPPPFLVDSWSIPGFLVDSLFIPWIPRESWCNPTPFLPHSWCVVEHVPRGVGECGVCVGSCRGGLGVYRWMWGCVGVGV